MGSGTKKKESPWVMGDYVPKDVDTEAFKWCINNNIKVVPKGTTTAGVWHILIILNGKINTSPSTYTKKDIWIKCYEYYRYYYEKYRPK